MRAVFIVQGEGRGHMTQALALAAHLRSAGHAVEAVLVGHSPRRSIPAYFREQIQAPVTTFESPNFLVSRDIRRIRVVASVAKTLAHTGTFRESLRTIDRVVRAAKPDVIISFYETLAGIYHRFYRPNAPMVCVAHQFMFLHPAYRFPDLPLVQRLSLRNLTRLMSPRAAKRLALSLYPADAMATRAIIPVPPLLRPALFGLGESRSEGFLLVYLLNEGYARDILAWHERRPEIPIHCFWDRADVPDHVEHDATLTFHRLNDALFLDLMTRCTGLVTTAGFEAVAEAMYLGKPVFMVPVEGQFEQKCNAFDAAARGAGMTSSKFDVDLFLDYLPAYGFDREAFRRWVESGPRRIVQEIETAVQ